MTTPEYVQRIVLPAAYALLPATCRSDAASALVIAIGFQESEFLHRVQMGGGPARGWFQFERAGVAGVLAHPVTQPLIGPVLDAMGYSATASACHVAIEHNDILCVVFTRLLLWTLPRRLPNRDEMQEGLAQYLEAWRPGKPRPEDWPQNFATAWQMVRT